MIGLRIGYELSMVRSPGMVAHTGVAGPAAFIAVGLFFVALRLVRRLSAVHSPL